MSIQYVLQFFTAMVMSTNMMEIFSSRMLNTNKKIIYELMSDFLSPNLEGGRGR